MSGAVISPVRRTQNPVRVGRTGVMRREDIYATLLECLPVGVVIIDGDGSTVFANSAGRSLIHEGLSSVGGLSLGEMVRRGKALDVARLSRGEGFVHAAFFEIEALTVAILFRPAPEPARLALALGRVYRLTEKERALAISIYEGCSLSEAARSLGIELSTARTHLKSIFGKTHTRRQSSLALLIASCAAAAATPPNGGCASANNPVSSPAVRQSKS